MDATQEQWLPVVGFEGFYEVSDHGRVRSLDRIVYFRDGRKRRSPGRILKPWHSDRGGYPVVGLKSPNRNRKAHVHILVLEAFVGPRPDGLACCHNDGNGLNNSLINLRWDTYSANNHDLVKHGIHGQGSKTHCPQGHEYTPENTRLYPYMGWTYRYCIQCGKASSRKYKEKLKLQRKKGMRTSKSETLG